MFSIKSWPGSRPDKYAGYALSRDKSLGASFFWEPGDVEQPFELVLRPIATVRGRVVDRWGDPIPDAEIWMRVSFPMDGPDPGYSGKLLPNPRDRKIRPDGTFEFRNLPAGTDAVFQVGVLWVDRSTVTAVARRYEATRELTSLKPGEILDLGDVSLKRGSNSTGD